MAPWTPSIWLAKIAAASSSSEAAALESPMQTRATSPSTTVDTALGVRAPDVAVPQDPGERREGVHESGHVGTDRRHLADPIDHELDRLRKLGEEHRLDQRGQRGQLAGGVGGFDRRVRRRFLDGVAEAAGRDQIDHEFGLPGERPDLVERAALAADLLGLAPVDVEDPESVQEVAPRAIGLRPEVQVDRLLTGLRAHAESACQLLEVGGEGRHRGVGRGLAHDLAHDQPVAHELQWQVRTHGEARTHGLVELRERRHSPAAHGREGLGEADGFDQVRRGGIEAFLAEERGDLGHPRNGERFRARPQVGVPARGLDARAVARLGGQAVERPRHPGGRGLHGLGQGAKGPIVLCGGRQLLEGGRVPRPAHDSDVGEALLSRFADAASHRRLALERQALPFRQCVAHGGHRFGDGGEEVAGIASRFDQAIPEALSVLLTRGFREL